MMNQTDKQENPNALPEMQQRIRDMENSMRTMRRITFVLAVFSCTVLAAGFIAADRILRIDKVEAASIQTGELSIADKNGRSRIRIGLAQDDAIAYLMMFGTDTTKPILTLNAAGTGQSAAIGILDSKGRQKFVIRNDNDTNSFVYCYNAEGKLAGGLFNLGGATALYARRIILSDTAGKTRATFTLEEADTFNPQISFFDKNGSLRTKMFHTDKGPSGLGLFDSKLKNRGLFGIVPAGKSYVLFNDSTGTPQVMIPQQ
jgi:hypothetical protein